MLAIRRNATVLICEIKMNNQYFMIRISNSAVLFFNIMVNGD